MRCPDFGDFDDKHIVVLSFERRDRGYKPEEYRCSVIEPLQIHIIHVFLALNILFERADCDFFMNLPLQSIVGSTRESSENFIYLWN